MLAQRAKRAKPERSGSKRRDRAGTATGGGFFIQSIEEGRRGAQTERSIFFQKKEHFDPQAGHRPERPENLVEDSEVHSRARRGFGGDFGSEKMNDHSFLEGLGASPIGEQIDIIKKATIRETIRDFFFDQNDKFLTHS